MTPKEKAEQLFQLYLPFVESGHIEEIKYRCKQCALIAVDEIMNVLNKHLPAEDYKVMNYYEEVKQEIEAL
jgi:hypothetical protein